MQDGLTRRRLLAHAATGAAASALGGSLVGRAARRPARGRDVPLPSPAQVRADNQRMVDFGPRLTGSPEHQRFIEWLQEELVDAGAQLLPCDDYEYERWSVGRFGLEVLDGASPGPVKVASYYTRSQETPEEGVDGAARVRRHRCPRRASPPATSARSRRRSRATRRSWRAGRRRRASRLGSAEGSILVVDLPMPAPITAGAFLPITPVPPLAGAHARRTGRRSTTSARGSCPGSACRSSRSRRWAPPASSSSSTRRGRRSRTTTCRSTTATSRCPRSTSTATSARRCARRRASGRRPG